MSYRIYLGSNAISNYDVKRNTHYTVTATIKGLNELDARIELNGATLAIEYYDYTDNMTGWFVYAKADASSSGMTWENARRECAKTHGWRLPTLTELELIYCLHGWRTGTGTNGFAANWYWTSTEDASNSSNAYAVRFGSNDERPLKQMDKNSSCFVRCIRDL